MCHANIDPIAGSFQNWDAQGRYRPPEEGWNSDMRPPGYGEQTIPTAQWSQSLMWLGDTISEDPLFAVSTVHTLYTGLTGQKPLAPPSEEPDPDVADAKLRAFETQDADFKAIAQKLVDANYNLKVAVKQTDTQHILVDDNK